MDFRPTCGVRLPTPQSDMAHSIRNGGKLGRLEFAARAFQVRMAQVSFVIQKSDRNFNVRNYDQSKA